MKTKFREIFLKAKDMILQYPMVLVMAFLAALCAILMNEYPSWKYHNFAITRFFIVSILGISLMFAIKMISQRIGKEILLQLLGILLLVGYYLILPNDEKHFTDRYVFLIFPLLILSHLLVAFGAFIRYGREISFWQYNKNLFINLFLTLIFTGVLTGGVELAILATDKLFDLHVLNHYYQNTFFFLLIFGSAFIFLLFNENGLPYLEKEDNYPVILKFFTQFVLIPLLLIYLVILYFYSIKILINWVLPRGWVSYLVLAYSVVGILALLLVHPLREEKSKSWVKAFSKIFYYTLLPLLILLFIAIFTRILEYGFTEARYYVLLIAIWLTSVVIYFIFFRKTDIRYIPISLFLFGGFALLMPYFNAFSVGVRSQKKELNQLLNKQQLLSNGEINFNKKVNYKNADEIGNKFEYLAERMEFDYLLNLVPQNKKPELKKVLVENNAYRVNTLVQEFFTKVSEKPKFQEGYLELYSTQNIFETNGY